MEIITAARSFGVAIQKNSGCHPRKKKVDFFDHPEWRVYAIICWAYYSRPTRIGTLAFYFVSLPSRLSWVETGKGFLWQTWV